MDIRQSVQYRFRIVKPLLSFPSPSHLQEPLRTRQEFARGVRKARVPRVLPLGTLQLSKIIDRGRNSTRRMANRDGNTSNTVVGVNISQAEVRAAHIS